MKSQMSQPNCPFKFKLPRACAQLVLFLVLLFGALPERALAQIVNSETQARLDSLAAFLCRPAASDVNIFPYRPTPILTLAPSLRALSPVITTDICAAWANLFASNAALMDSPNYQYKILKSIEKLIEDNQAAGVTITRDLLLSGALTDAIKSTVAQKMKDLLALIGSGRVAIVLTATITSNQLNFVMLHSEWMFIENKTNGLAAYDAAYLSSTPAVVAGGKVHNSVAVIAWIQSIVVRYGELTINPPTLTYPTSIDIATTSATLGGNVSSDGGAVITERGVVFSLTADNASPVLGGSGVTKVTASGTTGFFTVGVTGLAAGSGYSFKAYAINSAGTNYTSVAPFTTLENAPPAAPEQIFTRGIGLNLKIRIDDLLAACSDPNGGTLALQSVGPSAQGATLSTTATHILYSLAADVFDSIPYTITNGQGARPRARSGCRRSIPSD